jgi:hypothetical protein
MSSHLSIFKNVTYKYDFQFRRELRPKSELTAKLLIL